MANCYFAKPHGMQHCYIPFLYVIDFKGALDFGEAQELDVEKALDEQLFFQAFRTERSGHAETISGSPIRLCQGTVALGIVILA